MTPDPIVAEVRRIRQAHAAAHGYDLAAICADLKRKEAALGPRVVVRVVKPCATPAAPR